jgi:hypothetical protein
MWVKMNNVYRKKYNYTSSSPTATELHAEEDILISNATHTNDFINTEGTSLNKSGFSRQILIKVSSIKFHENPLSVSLINTRTDRQDVMKLTDFCQSA